LIERGITQSLAEQRISTQLPLVQKIEKADFILSNDGTPEALRLQVKHLTERLRRTGLKPISK
jgi:dephospho-CoA kinase